MFAIAIEVASRHLPRLRVNLLSRTVYLYVLRFAIGFSLRNQCRDAPVLFVIPLRGADPLYFVEKSRIAFPEARFFDCAPPDR
jgi:hypothetical protein